MTNTSRRLRALASRLCVFEEADVLTRELLVSAKYDHMYCVHCYMAHLDWTGHLAPWRATIQQELESIYAEHKSTRT